MDLNEEEIEMLLMKLSSVLSMVRIKSLGFNFNKKDYVTLAIDEYSRSYLNDDISYIRDYIKPTIGTGYIEYNTNIVEDIEEFGMEVPFDLDSYNDSGNTFVQGFTILINNYITDEAFENGAFTEEFFKNIEEDYTFCSSLGDESETYSTKPIQVKYIPGKGLALVFVGCEFIDSYEFLDSYVLLLETMFVDNVEANNQVDLRRIV